MQQLITILLSILEDVDLVAAERTREGSCRAILDELLDELDGIGTKADVIFLLTTNRPEILEPALAARPGRIDQAIEFPVPGAACRRPPDLRARYGRGTMTRELQPAQGTSAPIAADSITMLWPQIGHSKVTS
jgi:hypothetical protein